MNDIKNILINLGFNPVPDNGGYRMAAVHRNGDNPSALKVFSDNGNWIDFVENTRGSLEDLIKLIIGEKVNPKEWLADKNVNIQKKEYKEKLKVPEVFDENILKDLIPNFDYITEKRRISLETARLFSCGICLDSQTYIQKLKNRQIFCIYNSQRKLIGLSGRALDDNAKIRHKHLGNKSLWVYPAYLNHKIIQDTKEVILVEGVFDLMRMYDLGIKNVLVLWGTEASFSIVNYLLKVNPKKIFISTNDEIDLNGGVGNRAAEKIYARLKKYFNLNQIKIYLPPGKDFADESVSEKMIKDWYNQRYD